MRSSIWRTNRSLPSSTEFYYYLISFISIHFNTFFLLWIKFLLMRSAIWCTKRSLPSFTEFIFSYFRSAFRFLDVRRRWNSSTKETDGTKEPAFRKRIGAWTPFLSFPFFFWFFSFLFSLFPFGAYWLPWTLLLSRLFRLGSVCSPFPCPSHRFRRWSHDLFVSWFDKKAEKLGKTRSNTVPKGNHSREPDKTLENPVKLGNARGDSINTQCHDNLIKRE